MGQKRPVSIQQRPFLSLHTMAEIQSKFDHFGPQKGRWARNGPFPLKNGRFLVYSTIAEIQGKFDHFGPQKGRWARNGPFPLTAFSRSTAHSRNSKQISPFWAPKGQMGQKRPVSTEKRPFLVLPHKAEIRSKFDHFGPQKGRWARNGPFPLKNVFLVYSTIAEIQSKFDHFGPQKGRWARNGPFPLKNGLFLVYSTIAEIRSKFDHFGPQRADGLETARFH